MIPQATSANPDPASHRVSRSPFSGSTAATPDSQQPTRSRRRCPLTTYYFVFSRLDSSLHMVQDTCPEMRWPNAPSVGTEFLHMTLASADAPGSNSKHFESKVLRPRFGAALGTIGETSCLLYSTSLSAPDRPLLSRGAQDQPASLAGPRWRQESRAGCSASKQGARTVAGYGGRPRDALADCQSLEPIATLASPLCPAISYRGVVA